MCNICFIESLEFKGIQPDSQVMESPGSTEDIDCQVSEWSNWSKCVRCRGYTVSARQILVSNLNKYCVLFYFHDEFKIFLFIHRISNDTFQVPPRGNGKDCPKKLHRKRKCHKIPPCCMYYLNTKENYLIERSRGFAQ